MVLKEDEVELELGLAIGGSFRRPPATTKPSSERALDSRSNADNRFDSDPRENEGARREAHALRRQEARKKQRDKRFRSAMESPAGESDGGRNQKRAKTESLGSDPVNDPTRFAHAPAVRLVPVTPRGIAFPCVNVIPYWTTAFQTQQNGVPFRPMPWQGFRPFLAHPSFGLGVSKKNGDVISKTTSDHNSPMSSSSTVSDRHNHTSSEEGHGSSDTRTQNSSQSSREQTPPQKDVNNKLQYEAQSVCNSTIEDQRKTVQVSQPNTTNSKEANNAITTEVIIGKPPRPKCNNANKTTKPPPQMPYVSARGDGPEGKTVTGLLYRYNESEVSIVCECHGTTFSPAEFVRHAGGAHVSHPLRHITVVVPPPTTA